MHAGGGGMRGFVNILKVTPELWTRALPHRTQILYFFDISAIVFQLNLLPGSRVIESGTGSGSLTNALARSVAPFGHVYSFEFNGERVRRAKEEFRLLGLDGVVSVTHADAGADGFGAELHDAVDAVFLDLPLPWAAIPHAYAALKCNGILCCFSPCIEQVQRSCLLMEELGFDSLRTVEVIGCMMDVASTVGALPPPESIALSLGGIADSGGGAGRGPSSTVGSKRARPTDKGVQEGAIVSESAALLLPGAQPVPPFPSYCVGPAAAAQTMSVTQKGGQVPGHSGFLTFAALHRKRHPTSHVLASAKSTLDKYLSGIASSAAAPAEAAVLS